MGLVALKEFPKCVWGGLESLSPPPPTLGTLRLPCALMCISAVRDPEVGVGMGVAGPHPGGPARTFITRTPHPQTCFGNWGPPRCQAAQARKKRERERLETSSASAIQSLFRRWRECAAFAATERAAWDRKVQDIGRLTAVLAAQVPDRAHGCGTTALHPF